MTEWSVIHVSELQTMAYSYNIYNHVTYDI